MYSMRCPLFFYQVFQVSESRIDRIWWTLQVTGLWGQFERQYVSPTPSSYIFLKISKGRRYSYASGYGGYCGETLQGTVKRCHGASFTNKDSWCGLKLTFRRSTVHCGFGCRLLWCMQLYGLHQR